MQTLSSLPPIVDNIFDKYNKNLVPIRSLSDHDRSMWGPTVKTSCVIELKQWLQIVLAEEKLGMCGEWL